ncbi:hypothetical protein GF339_07650 [candidate division KSB3 bacterium]|uniref:Uncharacterized protein n=1 Tax=candidate division KSB3 bacterium TaxID=2044937 RepID=A0A9D5JUN6_9BACT|nr:hypothetical protein [candidate division KSB3 bacterium]MBD3324445.1 hypothetical protein [candidate division KSB3 bacterium]
MSDAKNDQVMYNKATGMYLKALAEMMKALDGHSEVRVEINGKLLKRAMDDGFLCVMSNDIRRQLWNYCYDNEILLARGPFPMVKATLNCIGWAFPYHSDDDKQRVHRLLIEVSLKHNGRQRNPLRRFWYNFRSILRVAPIEIPPNIVKITLTNAFYQTAVEVLSNVNLDTQQLFGNVIYAVSPLHYSLPEDYTADPEQSAFLETRPPE